ncbi:transposase [Alloscardovia criceti]|uniref:transposase n=1 Tax=Alloscardovia criceti TaxID=356828 RepID=UPI000375F544|nr:transposase [Alloscardovia criceti]
MVKRKQYSAQTKLSAAQDHVDHSMPLNKVMEKYDIASRDTLLLWCRQYRREGAESFAPESLVEREVAQLIEQSDILAKSTNSKEINREKARIARLCVKKRYALSDVLPLLGLKYSTYHYISKHPIATVHARIREKVMCLMDGAAAGKGHRKVAELLRSEFGMRVADKTVLSVMRELKNSSEASSEDENKL